MTAVRRTDRNDEWWVDFRWKGRRVRAKAPLQTRRGAEQYERQLRRQYSDDEDHGMNPFAGPPPRFADFAERWMRDYVMPRNKQTTQTEKRSYLVHHLLPAFGKRSIDDISTMDVQAFIARRVERGLSPKTINNVLATLRCALNVAKDWKLVRDVPRIEGLRVPERPYKYLTQEEIERVIDAATPGYWRALITFIADTGVRFGEAAALSWAHVNLTVAPPIATIAYSANRGQIGTTKTNRVRHIPLTPRAVEALHWRPRHSGLIFERPSGGPPRPDSTLASLHRVCDRAGITRVSWHTLRHSYATLLCQRGVPLRNVQDLLGHTTIAMTSRYTHAAPSDTARWVYHALVPAKSSHRTSVEPRNGHQVVTNPVGLTPHPAHRTQEWPQPTKNPDGESRLFLVDPIGFEAVKQVNAMIAKRTNCTKTKEERKPFENGAHPDQ